MKDGVIKHDGTSRLIKANLPATYEEMRTMAAAGTLPMDIFFNAAGWSILPDFLNVQNLFQNETALLMGLGTDAVPNDAFLSLYNTKHMDEELVWENASPTSDFAAQTVSLDLSDADFCRIESYGGATVVCPVTDHSAMDACFCSGYGDNERYFFGSRRVSASPTGVTFEYSYGFSLSSNNPNPGGAGSGGYIPNKIYKIRRLPA